MEILKIIISIPLAWMVVAFGIGTLRDLLEGKIIGFLSSLMVAAVGVTILFLMWQ